MVDFDEEVMVFEVAEPVDPADFDLLAELAIVRHFLDGMKNLFYIFFKFIFTLFSI